MSHLPCMHPRETSHVSADASLSDSEPKRICGRSQEEEEASAAALSFPAPFHLRLYRHALESIFGFCSLFELHVLSSVCREWSAAVLSMRPIDGTIGGYVSDFHAAPFLARLEASRLVRRHGRNVSDYCQARFIEMNGLLLSILSLALPRIRRMHCTIIESPSVTMPMLIAPSLRVLEFCILSFISDVFRYVVQLTAMEEITLQILEASFSTVDFTHLNSLRFLRQLRLGLPNFPCSSFSKTVLSSAQMEQLMHLPLLEMLEVTFEPEFCRCYCRDRIISCSGNTLHRFSCTNTLSEQCKVRALSPN
jgi:hypothetical protein